MFLHAFGRPLIAALCTICWGTTLPVSYNTMSRHFDTAPQPLSMWCVVHSGVSLGHDPHVAVSALASYFQAGCSQATVPSSLTGSKVVQQVIAVGQKLIQVHQVAHMHHLLGLAGEAADTAGAAFLRVSLSLYCITHTASTTSPAMHM